MIAEDFLKYFLNPNELNYDIFGTLLYSIIFAIAVYFIYSGLKKLKVKIDSRLVIAIAPWIVCGSTLRVLQDAKILNSIIFITPWIYVFVFLIFFSLLLLSLLIERKKNIFYFKIMFIAGLITDSFLLSQLNFVNFYGIALVFVFFLPWPAILYFVKWDVRNRMVLSIHMFDASVTVVALKFFAYFEKHVLPSFVIGLSDPLLFIPLKLFGVVIVLVLIDKFSNDKEFNNYLKLCIGVLGAATGLRDFITLFALI